MQIEYTKLGHKPTSVSVSRFFEQELDESDYHTGKLEAAADTAANNSRALGELCELLLERGILLNQDINTITGSYADKIKVVRAA